MLFNINSRQQRLGGLVIATWLLGLVMVVRAAPAQIGVVEATLERYELNRTASTETTSPKPVPTAAPKSTTPGVCGDGIIDFEAGEECDCGDRNDCKYSRTSCCDYRTCKLVKEAVCDSSDPLQTCCDRCQYRPVNALCRASKSPICDPIEEKCTGTSGTCPEDQTTPNETPCGDGLTCASGLCTSRDDFCQNNVKSQPINDDTFVYDRLGFLKNNRTIEISGLCKKPTHEEDRACSWVGTCGLRYADGDKEELEECFVPVENVPDVTPWSFPNGTDCSSNKFGKGICVEGACLRLRNFQGQMRYENREEHDARVTKKTYPSAVKMDVILGAVLGTLGGIIFVVAVIWVWCSGRGGMAGFADDSSESTRYTVEEILVVRPQRESMLIEKTLSGTGTLTGTVTTTEVTPEHDELDRAERTTTERSDHQRIKVTAVEADEEDEADEVDEKESEKKSKGDPSS
ncbi:Disintegrin-domain-containing protein [Ascobolus immersus RN42]|uniref:Disintegrin-domain-containing protein n=1 Tax=Ascobolus immersus RN42 TaxID=1160509 RepID=A0A3N4HMV0_ASCIM|nr:Disintegrin-domain-containing protein [Ascobolus immersus RN42]